MIQDLENEIRALVADVTEKDPQEITLEAKFVEDLGMDSMMALEIMAAMEKKYKIMIPEEKLTQLTTLKDTVAVVKEFIEKKGQNV